MDPVPVCQIGLKLKLYYCSGEGVTCEVLELGTRNMTINGTKKKKKRDSLKINCTMRNTHFSSDERNHRFIHN